MLWIIGRIGPTDWNETEAMVVRAESEKEARKVAAKDNVSAEDVWLDPTKSKCETLQASGNSQVILAHVKYG